MRHLNYKNLEKKIIKSDNLDAMCYLLEISNSIIVPRLHSFKYTHSDLNDSERNLLLRLNNLNENDVLMNGGEVHRVVGDVESRKHFLTKVDEIELFTIMSQINWIKTKEEYIITKIKEN